MAVILNTMSIILNTIAVRSGITIPQHDVQKNDTLKVALSRIIDDIMAVILST